MNKAGVDLVKKWEGFRDEAYLCPAGVWTIGYGFTKGVKPGDKITEAEAAFRLKRELDEFKSKVLDVLYVPANENQLAAMTSLAYNIGPGAFKNSSVQRFHNQGDFDSAANSFLLWNKAAGKVLAGLVKRREEEAALYRTPV